MGVTGQGWIVTEDRNSGVTIAAGYVSQDLVVGTVFTDDDEDVLDLRRSADSLRDGEGFGTGFAAGRREDVSCEIPVVIHEYL